MIDMKPFDASDVLVQFKKALYLVASVPEGLVIVSADQKSPSFVDRVSGHLRIMGDQPVVSYVNPANPQEQVDILIDPENVASVWVKRSISVVSSLG